jgi:hypothetical protein
MLLIGILDQDFAGWTLGLTLGVGIAVSASVFTLLSLSWRQRRLARIATNAEHAWEQLLQRLGARQSELAASGATAADDLSPEKLLALLLVQPLSNSDPHPDAATQEERRFQEQGGVERRSSPRRWGNPTQVYLHAPRLARRLRGLVINRSDPGLAIFVNQQVPLGTTLTLRPVEAPESVPSVEITVRNCRKIKRNYIIGCEAPQEIPWNVRGWLG